MIFTNSFFRFCCVGILGSSINYITFYICFTFFNVNYIFSGMIGFLVPLPLVFILNKVWTFKSTVSTKNAFVKYFFTNLISMYAHMATQIFSHEWIGVPQLYTQLLGLLVSAILNYYLAKLIVY